MKAFAEVHTKKNELPDADVVSAFTYGTTNEALVHELERGN
jgi:hypothetical protein